MYLKRRNRRFIEISAGFFLIFTVLAILISILLNFNYTFPHTTLEEDIDFLKDSISSQKVSAIAWIITGSINLFFLPVYLIIFHKFQKRLFILNGIFILIMAYSFFNIGLSELGIATILNRSEPQIIIADSNYTSIVLLKIRQIVLLHKIGLIAFGAFATIFTISRFNKVKFPVLGRMLTFFAGPVVIIFTWINPDHIVLTSSLAIAWTGLLIIGARLVIRGIEMKSN